MEDLTDCVVVNQLPERAFAARRDDDQVIAALLERVDDGCAGVTPARRAIAATNRRQARAHCAPDLR
jgi:hypothetical protein